MSHGVEDLDTLILNLGKANRKERIHAARAIGKSGDSNGINSLIKHLTSKDREFLASVVDSLGQLRSIESIDRLTVLALEHESSQIRLSCLRALEFIGNEKAISCFLKCMEDPNDNIRYFSMKGLVKLGEKSIDALLQLISNDRWIVRSTASDALVQIGKPVVEKIHQQMASADADQLYWLIYILGNLSSKQSAAYLAAYLDSEDENIIFSTLQALEKIEHPVSVEKLINFLASYNQSIQIAAKNTLISFGEKVIDPLVNHFDSDLWKVKSLCSEILSIVARTQPGKLIERFKTASDEARYWIIKSCQDFADETIARELVAQFEDIRDNLKIEVLLAIKKCSNKNRVGFLIKCLESDNPKVVEIVREILISTGDSCIHKLCELLAHPVWSVRKNVSYILVGIGEFSIPYLIKQVESENSDMVYWAIQSLIAIGKKAIYPLTNLLDKTRPVFTQVQIIRALGKLQASSAVKYIESCLMDEFWENRIAAAEALGEIGDDDSIKPLLKVLGDLDETLRAQAVFALGKIGNKKVIYDISKHLSDEFSVQINAIRALGMIKNPSGLIYLYPYLKSPSLEILKEVVRALFLIGENESLKKMSDLFNEVAKRCLGNLRELPWEEFCIMMINEFAEIQYTGIFNTMKNLSQSLYKPVREAVVHYCGKIRTAGSEKLLVVMLSDASFRIRYSAFQELATISQYKKIQAPKEKNRVEEAKKEFNLGLMFFKKDRMDEAIVCFNKTIRYLPQFSLGYFNLGIVYQKKGFAEKAVEMFQLSIMHDKKFLKGYFYLGALLGMRKEFSKARDVLDTALKGGNTKSKFYNYIKNYTKTLDKMELENALEKKK